MQPPRTSTGTLTATQRVLYIQPPTDPGYVVFSQRDIETDVVAVRVAITQDMWQDFGEPGELTATLKPGDQLTDVRHGVNVQVDVTSR